MTLVVPAEFGTPRPLRRARRWGATRYERAPPGDAATRGGASDGGHNGGEQDGSMALHEPVTLTWAL